MSVKYQKIYVDSYKSRVKQPSIYILPEISDPAHQEKFQDIQSIVELGRKTKEKQAQGPRNIHKNLNTSSNLKLENIFHQQNVFLI